MKGFTCLWLAVFLAAAAARSAETSPNSIDEQSARSGSSGVFGDLRYVYQVYKDCSGAELSSCLKLKLLTAMDRVSRTVQLNVVDGVTIVKDEGAATEEEPRSLQDIEASLPRSLEDREDTLNSLILDKVVSFFQSYTLKLKLPNVEELQRSLTEEGEALRGVCGKRFEGFEGFSRMLGRFWDLEDAGWHLPPPLSRVVFGEESLGRIFPRGPSGVQVPREL